MMSILSSSSNHRIIIKPTSTLSRSISSSSTTAQSIRRYLSPSFRTRWTNLLFYSVATVSILAVSSIGLSSNALPCPARPNNNYVGLDSNGQEVWEITPVVDEELMKKKKVRNRRWLEDPFVPKPAASSIPKRRSREDEVLRKGRRITIQKQPIVDKNVAIEGKGQS